MTTLTDFLLARIAEDEEVARATADAGGYPSSEWWAEGSWWLEGAEMLCVGKGNAGADVIAYAYTEEDRVHIARHDPARVLAECEAKRRIVELGQFSDSPESAVDFWLEEGKGRTPPQPLGTLVEVFRILALPYADHSDFRPEWRL